jgi:hypothetical protein
MAVPPVDAYSDQTDVPAVTATNPNGTALVVASTHAYGIISRASGADAGAGVYGESRGFNGVRGVSYAPGHGATVGISEHHTPEAGPGVFGQSDQVGVWGHSKNWVGVYGESENPNAGAGVWGRGVGDVPGVLGDSQNGPGVWGRGATAGRFEGNVDVTGDIRLLNADGAEEFEIAEAEAVEPGTVMVLGDEGVLCTSCQAYDKRVAGIVSGAGTYRPALVLDRQENGGNRLPIALFGKVFCKVDAAYGTVAIGDLLTTSPTPGHAMKAADPLSAFGAVIGKALRPLGEGQGLIPVLVSLQ